MPAKILFVFVSVASSPLSLLSDRLCPLVSIMLLCVSLPAELQEEPLLPDMAGLVVLRVAAKLLKSL